MNRQQRRAEAAKMRNALIEDARTYMAAVADPTIAGITMILPDDQPLYVSAEAAQGPSSSKPGGLP